MEQYIVTGMSCAACSSRVEKAVSKVPGVTSCSVSLLTNSMGVEGTASEQEIIKQSQMPDTEHRKRRRSGKDTVIISICRRRYVKRQNDTGIKEASDCITWIPDRPDVFLHGSYDVGMAGSGIYER